MANRVTLGGDRLGAGSKNTVELKEFGRSTQNLDYVMRTSASSGTLIPFMAKLGIAGDRRELELDVDVTTNPTTDIMLGSWKVQLDIFTVDWRLFQPQVILNIAGQGHNMRNVLIPQMRVEGNDLDAQKGVLDNQQIGSSALLKYLGFAGIGRVWGSETPIIAREFNALKLLAYMEIGKCYYMNKQEKKAYIIHNNLAPTDLKIDNSIWKSNKLPYEEVEMMIGVPPAPATMFSVKNTRLEITFVPGTYEEIDPQRILVWYGAEGAGVTEGSWWKATDIFPNFNWDENNNMVIMDGIGGIPGMRPIGAVKIDEAPIDPNETEPKLLAFDLKNIDKMRKDILKHDEDTGRFLISKNSIEPYGQMFKHQEYLGRRYYSLTASQEGLLVKTYNSDLFNNWLMTELIDGNRGMNEVARVDTTKGFFTINELLVTQKVFNVLNAVAVTDGTIDGWQLATSGVERMKQVHSPVYRGGLIRELVFSELTSMASTDTGAGGVQPLGKMAGKGTLTNKHKGGRVTLDIKEPCYIMGIFSLTPRVDYSQGNEWDGNLKNWDELHKAEMDTMGFQDLITEQMAFWTTEVKNETQQTFKKSAGKQPAFINYTTEVNRCYGTFADQADQMFMTLNRRYEPLHADPAGGIGIKDLTTYIDPKKYNYIWAYGRRDAQNFRVQIRVRDTARRVMSAKQIPRI